MKNLVQIIRNIVIKNDGMLILEARLCNFADSGVALHPSPLQKHFSPRVSGISSGDVITHNSSTSSVDEHFRILNCRLFNSENQSVNPFFDHLYQSNFYYKNIFLFCITDKCYCLPIVVISHPTVFSLHVIKKPGSVELIMQSGSSALSVESPGIHS